MTYRQRVTCPDFPIHVRARANNKENFPLALAEVWSIFSDYLYIFPIGFGIEIHSFVLMSNHFHLILRDPQSQLPKAMEYFMRETSREIGRRTGRINRIWGGRFSSTRIDSEIYRLHAYKYVYRNPVKAGLCKSVLDYPYSTIRQLLGIEHGIIPLTEDRILFENVEATLSWLETPQPNEDGEAIRKALGKKVFSIGADRSSRMPNHLSNWASVPAQLHQTPAKSN